MKKTVIAALFSGLFVLAVPQVVFAHEEAADHSGDCGAKTEQTADSEQKAPDEHPYGDKEAHDGDDTTLF